MISQEIYSYNSVKPTSTQKDITGIDIDLAQQKNQGVSEAITVLGVFAKICTIWSKQWNDQIHGGRCYAHTHQLKLIEC